RSGNIAVRHNDALSSRGEEMRRSPINLDDPPFDAAVQGDPVANVNGAFDIESDAGEQVAKRALQCKTENDGDYAGSRQQAGDGKIEDEPGNSENNTDVNRTGQKFRCELPLLRSMID